MGSAGHAFVAHTKSLSPASSVRDGGWGDAPHPLEVRVGQRFWPRSGRRKRAFAVKRVLGETVLVQRLDQTREQARITRKRLLAVRESDGQGRYYAFAGFVSRRYDTYAYLAAADGETAFLVLPEWHPARPVKIPLRQLPFGSRAVGGWYRVEADLSASSAPRLGLAGLTAAEDPGPERQHRPAWSPTEAPRDPAPPPASGYGCGDIVVHVPESVAQQWRAPASKPTRELVVQAQRPPEVHRTGPTPRLAEGARLYLASGGHVLGYVTVLGQRRHPGGVEIFTTSATLQPAEPVAAFEPFHNWRWRWWPRAAD